MQTNRKYIKNLLLGKPLETKAMAHERLNEFWGFPIMASDATSSVAYALEEILLVLVPALGLGAVAFLGTVTIPIIILLLILVFSYTQIINHYKNGGGAYVVSAENLGRNTSLVAASALIIDYILTVAVSISSASEAIIAAFPYLAPYKVGIALIGLFFITLINLRGARESSKAFGIPTYVFIGIAGLMIGMGLVGMIDGNLKPIQYADSAVHAANAEQGIMLVLLLRAFSSGCSALTGIEAISNAVPSFKEPSQKTARHVLFMLAAVIVYIFGGSVALGAGLHVVPLPDNTVLSQMGSAIFGPGSALYYLLQFTTTLILILAANTAYTGLPTLLSILGQDGFMPRQFAQRGAKLSFSNGIMFLFIVAAVLLIVFGASTHHLIPLYAVGVFLSFTLSQTGMFIKWIKTKDKGWLHKAMINGAGAIITAVTTVIVFSTKFEGGAWMLAIAIPLIAIMMMGIKKHYNFVARQLKIEDFERHYHRSSSNSKAPCIVLISGISKSTLKSLNYANTISSNVTALYVSTDDTAAQQMRNRWTELKMDIPLVVVQAPYRDIIEPIEEYIAERESKLDHGEDITVVLVKFVKAHFYDNLLHNQTTYFLMSRLMKHRNIATMVVPYIYKDIAATQNTKSAQPK